MSASSKLTGWLFGALAPKEMTAKASAMSQ